MNRTLARLLIAWAISPRKDRTMNRKFLTDAAERVAATAIEAAVAVILLSGTLDLSTGKKAAVAGTMAGLAAVKALVARFTGSPDTAAVGQ